MPVITRIAPSPTGQFHLGTARTALFNYLYAKCAEHQGKFILRIDDTDAARNTKENVDIIFNSMEWLGLEPDEVHYQSNRSGIHLAYATSLLDRGLAVKGEDGGIRLNLTELPENFMWRDMLVRTPIPVTRPDFEVARSIAIMRPDGTFLYNFASVVDDIDLGVTHIIRGCDHTPNTSKQELLRHAIAPNHSFSYAHLGLITLNKKKISKRNPDHVAIASLQTYMSQEGANPDAFKNWILRMGWGPSKDDATTTILPMARALELFVGGGKMKNSPAEIDLPKLASYLRKYNGA